MATVAGRIHILMVTGPIGRVIRADACRRFGGGGGAHRAEVSGCREASQRTVGDDVGSSVRPLLLHSAAVDLDLSSSERGDHSVLSLRGEIDVYTAPLLRQAILDLLEQNKLNVVVDMTEVDFLDSTGLGVLVEGLKRVRSREGSFSIVATQDKILKIFDITGLNKAFPIHPSVDQATGRPAPEPAEAAEA